jgi:predicted RNA methylase
MKLSKRELKEQTEIYEFIKSKEKFTYEELERIYETLNPGFISDVTSHSAYFTPLDLAYDFALFGGRHGIVVDMCAGIGVLSFAALTRDTYDGKIKKIICIERNPEYVKIGKKLVPEAEWICGDVFDRAIWDDIKTRYGKIDCINSNPPFGKVSKTSVDRSWLKYTGADIDIACIEIAMVNAEWVDLIIPPNSCTFRYSGRPYYEEYENKKIEKLKRETGLDFYMSCHSVDCSIYKEQWKNTNIVVESLSVLRPEQQ